MIQSRKGVQTYWTNGTDLYLTQTLDMTSQASMSHSTENTKRIESEKSGISEELKMILMLKSAT